MLTSVKRLGPFGVVALALASCVATTPHAEYAAHRAVEGAPAGLSRLATLRDYVDRFDGGRWSEAYAAELRASEAAVWTRGGTDAKGLTEYLAIYPAGRYASLARARLAALEAAGSRRRDGAVEVACPGPGWRAPGRASWVESALRFYARSALTVRGLGRPLAELGETDPELHHQLFERQPDIACDASLCRKRYGMTFTVPRADTEPVERAIALDVRLDVEAGHLHRLSVLLPYRGFSRWYELEVQEHIDDDDPVARQRAVDWALDRLLPLVRAHAVDARPATIERSAQEWAVEFGRGRRLVLLAAGQGVPEDAAYDGFVVERSAR